MEEEKRRKVTIRNLNQMKASKQLIVALGVYDSPMTAIADKLGFEVLLIGPSGPMSLFGHSDVRTIKPEEMLFMTQAVSRIARFGLVVASLPYMTYELSKSMAIKTAAQFVTLGGAECVKCDSNSDLAGNVAAIVKAGIPVMAHIGLQASRKVQQSGYGVRGRTAEDAKRIVDDARSLIDGGVFALLVERIPAEVTQYLAETMAVPIISLGSGSQADGICIVSGDAVGFSVYRRPPGTVQFLIEGTECTT